MSWYYAENNERRGPIEDAAFQTLVASGAIKPDTLVWREGMAEWTPYSRVQGPSGATAGPVGTAGAGVSTAITSAVGATGATGAGTNTCSQCGRVFPADEMIFLAGRSVCAQCKPLVVQQMMEGTDVGAAPFDPVAFLADLRARGGYRLDVGYIFSRAWGTVTANFWPCFGVTILVWLVFVIAQQIPCVGIFSLFILKGPLYGGLSVYFLKQLRGQPAVLNDAFIGFNNPHFGRLALAGTVQTLIAFAVAVVLVGPGLILNWAQLESSNPEVPWTLIIGIFLAMIPIIYLMLSWLFSFILILDRRMDFWPAMELSRKVIGMNFWGWFGLSILAGLLSTVGMLALCFGLFVAMAITYCGLMVVYEDIFSQTRNRLP